MAHPITNSTSFIDLFVQPVRDSLLASGNAADPNAFVASAAPLGATSIAQNNAWPVTLQEDEPGLADLRPKIFIVIGLSKGLMFYPGE